MGAERIRGKIEVSAVLLSALQSRPLKISSNEFLQSQIAKSSDSVCCKNVARNQLYKYESLNAKHR